MSDLPRSDDEDGAVAILYSVALLMMMGLLALTIDIGALRYDRAHSQSVADMASVAGALDLQDIVDGNPRKACETAWDYFLVNSVEQEDPAGQTPCTAFPDVMPSACLATSLRGEGTTSNYAVHIYWPVHPGPLFDPADGDPELDGDDPCERIAVHVGRTRGFVFGPAVGQAEGSTGAPAVARAVVAEEGKEVASLIILDKVGCSALITTGGGSVRVMAAEDREEPGTWKPGMIHVDSDASACPGTAYTIDARGTGYIVAEGDGATPPEGGVIRLLAQPAGATTCQGKACEPGDILPTHSLTSPGIWPQPGNLPERTNRTPAEHRYNCKTDYSGLDGEAPRGLAWDVGACTGDTAPYIDQLESAFRDAHAANPDPWSATNPTGYQSWTGTGLPCAPGDLIAPPGNWYVDCPRSPGFQVSGTVVFPTGNVVFKSSVSINAGGNLSINTANPSPALPPGCQDAMDAVCRRASARSSGIVYFADGADLTQSTGTAQLNVHNSMVFLQGGSVKITGGSFNWSAPTEGPFEDLALWSDRPATHPVHPDENSLEGTGSTRMEGIYVTPNSLTKVAGGGSSTPLKAQFFTWDMHVTGGGALMLEPDPERNLQVKVFEGVLLIR